MGGFQIPFYLQRPEEEDQQSLVQMPLPTPAPASAIQEETGAAIIRRLMQEAQAKQSIQSGIDAGSQFATTFPQSDPDEDLQTFFTKLVSKKMGDQQEREREMRKTPMDYARARYEAFYGPEPTTKKGKVARGALQFLSGVLGVQQPDFMQQGFEEWKERQKQYQNEANTEQRLLMGQLQAVSAAKKNESMERMKNMGSQAQFMIQAMKSQTDAWKSETERIKLLQQQGLIDAKTADTLASATKKNLETSFMNTAGPLAYALKGQPLATQLALLENLGEPEMAKSLAESIGLTEAAKALGKSSSGQGSSSSTIERVPVYAPDGVTVLGYKDAAIRTRVSTPNGQQSNPAAAYNAAFQQQFGTAPQQAQPVSPSQQIQPVQPVATGVQPVAPKPASVNPVAPASKPLGSTQQDEIPKGWVEIPTHHLPNLSQGRPESSTIYGYAVSDGPVYSIGKEPKISTAEKDRIEAKKAALSALGQKARAAVDSYLDNPPQEGIMGGGMLPLYERFLNRMKANAGTNMQYMFSGGNPARRSAEEIRSDADLFRRQQAETAAVLLEEQALVGRRGGPAMADRVKTMFSTNIMSPQLYVQSSIFNSLLKNTAEKLRALGMEDKYADARLVSYIDKLSQSALKRIGTAATAKNEKAKEQERQAIYNMLDPDRVLVGFLHEAYPGQTEFRNKTAAGKEWIMTIGKPGKKYKSALEQRIEREAQNQED